MKDILTIVKESNESHYDVFGENMKIGDNVVFYYENGIKNKDDNDNTKTPRLYAGILKDWDREKLIGTIQSKEFDQTHYNIPKTIKVHQLLILKYK